MFDTSMAPGIELSIVVLPITEPQRVCRLLDALARTGSVRGASRNGRDKGSRHAPLQQASCGR